MWNLLKYVWNHPLNADGRFAALWRVFRWQLAVRLMPGLIALPYVQGTWLFATRGMTGATSRPRSSVPSQLSADGGAGFGALAK
jgi:hypothetical protein